MRKSGNLSTTLIISGVVLLVASTFLLFIMPNMLKPPTDLWLGDGIFRAKLALNDVEREKGLSGTEELQSDQILLMAFPYEDKWSIWMKDMNFPIDIVWLNSAKKVVFIKLNATPESYPDKFLPKTNASYVVELPAGTVESKSIKVGKFAVFEIDKKDIK
ncbi:MAG: DUF192 domain-containing protein [Candidatus Saccharibacteria bacterium]